MSRTPRPHWTHRTPSKLSVALFSLVVLAGCANVSVEKNVDRINHEAAAFTDGQLTLERTQRDRVARANSTRALLTQPLTQSDAVRLSLVNSPALQALIAQGWADTTEAAQTARIANPSFSFERMVSGSELEVARALSFGLLELITLPARYGVAQRRIELSQLRLTGDVVDHVTQVRQAWVRAVSAQENQRYAQQVYESAEAGAELARRMQAAGNFNRITRAREQAFYAEAGAKLSIAVHQAMVNREVLGRLLGLDEAQTKELKLPKRLPDLPAQPMEAEMVASRATKDRLDIRLAQMALDSAAKVQGLEVATSLTDIELTGRRNTTFDDHDRSRSTARGWEFSVRLPVFDWGGLQRDAMNARTLASAHLLEQTVRAAGSHLRESYSAYRSSYELARHYRDEVVPLRKVISEENQLRYNGMLISVFELLADAREQVGVVTASLEATQQFWLADAAMQAALIGKPSNASLSLTSSASGSSVGAASH